MKILITFYPIDDMGGIINHTEQLAIGLRELGHEVTARLLVWKDQAPRSVAGGRGTPSVLGMEFDQRKGYSWASHQIIPYKGQANVDKWLAYASTFDLIIWQIPVPTKRKENRGNMDWLGLYNSSAKQLAVIHDGNFLDSYPWLHFVRGRLQGLACVHNCAFNSAMSISCPSRLILNPFEIVEPDLSKRAFDRRMKGFLSVQTWKAWKRVPELLRAIPYMDSSTAKFVAGRGIDFYYLTSKDKCKYPGVWDDASRAGFTYMDVITNESRDHYLRNLTCQIDASWSKKYAAIGAHFNRVTVEAILAGCIPVVRDVGVRGSVLADCPQIPWGATPEQFAEIMDHYCNVGYGEYSGIMEELVGVTGFFDRKYVASQFSDFSPACIGTTSDEVKIRAYAAIQEFFHAQ
jgi:hypothetical protein